MATNCCAACVVALVVSVAVGGAISIDCSVGVPPLPPSELLLWPPVTGPQPAASAAKIQSSLCIVAAPCNRRAAF